MVLFSYQINEYKTEIHVTMTERERDEASVWVDGKKGRNVRLSYT